MIISRIKTRISLALKIAFVSFLFVLLIRKANIDALTDLLKDISIGYFIVVVFIHFIDKVFMGFKWNYLLKIFGVQLSVRLPILAYLRARVFNIFTPAGIGIDIYKVLFLKKYTNNTTNIIASVFIERLIGAVSTIAFVSLLLYFPLTHFQITTPFLATTLGVALFLVISIIIYSILKYSYSFRKIQFRCFFPERIKKTLNHAILILSNLGNDRKKVILYFLLSTMEKMAYGTVIYFCARSVRIDNINFFFIVSVASFLALIERLPITISAIGVREGLFVVLFLPYFQDFTISFTIALVFRLADIVLTVLCLFFWMDSFGPKFKNAEVTSVKELLKPSK
jgi:uncharacterized protein (TIRG00374 family)